MGKYIETNIKGNESKEWIQLSQDRVNCQAIVLTVTDL
jgi:hypothetical protein